MIRATTVGVLKGYKSNLMKSFISLNSARRDVLKPRNFQSYADDPATASQAYQIRRALQRTASQLSVSQEVTYKYESAWAALNSVVDRVDNEGGSAHDAMLRVLDDPKGDARTALGKVLTELGNDIVQSMNTKYGDTFVFAGADGLNVPFEVREDGHLYYRGVNVDTEVPKLVSDSNGAPVTVDKDGNYDPNGTYYLKSRTTTIMSKEDYEAKSTLLKDASGNPLWVDAHGVENPGDAFRFLVVESQTTPVTEADFTAEGSDYIVLRDTNGNPVPRLDENGNPAVDLSGNPLYSAINKAMVTQEEYDSSVPNVFTDQAGNLVPVTKDGVLDTTGEYYIVMDNAQVISQDDYKTAQTDLAKLDFMLGEKNFVDIGLGLQENLDDELIQSSAFDETLQGISFLGYGVDKQGHPKNIFSLIRKMGDMAVNYDDAQWVKGDSVYEEFDQLVGKFEKMASEFKVMHSDMDAQAKALKNNNDMLTDNADTLKEQIHDLEDMDDAEAITSFIWAQYCYNAALKVGNSILSESLMDYMS